jgi:4-cresol dehydrogenase (hydroxylating)
MEDDWLPPGFDAAKLTQAQRAFEAALGAGKVFFERSTAPAIATSSRSQEGAHLPAGAIGPTTVEEVQAALRIANQYRLPVWPISRGKNLGYGGSAPLLSGSVVMDLAA